MNDYSTSNATIHSSMIIIYLCPILSVILFEFSASGDVQSTLKIFLFEVLSNLFQPWHHKSNEIGCLSSLLLGDPHSRRHLLSTFVCPRNVLYFYYYFPAIQQQQHFCRHEHEMVSTRTDHHGAFPWLSLDYSRYSKGDFQGFVSNQDWNV